MSGAAVSNLTWPDVAFFSVFVFGGVGALWVLFGGRRS